MIVLWSRERRSNMRTLPSAPHETNVSTLPAQNFTSYTSLSWAMSCVFAVSVGMSQIVHVVSILLVMMSFGESWFQSSDVNGAVCSGVFELDRSARGVSFAADVCFWLALDDLGMVLLDDDCVGVGNDHSLRWSPDVANRSVICFCCDGGSHNMRVIGYEHVASAIRLNLMPCCGKPGAANSCGSSDVSNI